MIQLGPACHALHLRILLRPPENPPILKAFKKNFSRPATAAGGTSIAMYLVRRPPGENQYGNPGSAIPGAAIPSFYRDLWGEDRLINERT